MSKLNLLEKVCADRTIIEILRDLASGTFTEAQAYELVCEAFRKDLETFSAKENIRNAATLESI